MSFILSAILLIAAFFVWRKAGVTAKNEGAESKPLKTAALLGMFVFAGMALFKCFTQVPAGHVGVVDFFGIISSRTIPAGIHPVNPLARVIKLSIQTKEHKKTMGNRPETDRSERNRRFSDHCRSRH